MSSALAKPLTPEGGIPGEVRLVADTVKGERVIPKDTEPLAFGRAPGPAGVPVAVDDLGVSSVSGTLRVNNVEWTVVNLLGDRRIVVDRGENRSESLLKGSGVTGSDPAFTVLIDGRHELHVRVEGTFMPPYQPFNPNAGDTGSLMPALDSSTEKAWLATAAVRFRGLIDPGRYAPHPLSAGATAEYLGYAERTVRDHCDELRGRLAEAGFKGLLLAGRDDPRAGSGGLLLKLADYLILHDKLTPRFLRQVEAARVRHPDGPFRGL